MRTGSRAQFLGNVRELKNMVERADAMGAKDQITLTDLSTSARRPSW